jgi:hypothetical protein
VDLAATVFSSGWASGVNAYATVAMLSGLAKAGVAGVPEQLDNNAILIGALIMFAVEFIADKVPYFDSLWDSVHTVIRPAIGSALGFTFTGDAEVSSLDEALGGGGAGLTALASHGVKAGLRLGINTSPEPASNIIASLTEDSLTLTVAYFAIENPELAAAIAFVLLVAGIILVILLWKSIRAAWKRYRQWRHKRRGPPHHGAAPP